MKRSQHLQMRDAINDVELALNGLAVDDLVKAWDGASNDVTIKVRLGDIRRLARCYPALNRIINDPAFERKS
jgi:hypothetical protein